MNPPRTHLLHDYIPPALFRLYRRHVRKIGYFGSFTSWAGACAASKGYDDNVVLDRVRSSLAQVRDGIVAYERDGVLFTEIHHSWPLLSGLLWVASRCGNRLRLLDYGGSLGSSYYQNKHFLDHLYVLRWCIVEQPSFVACGKKEFADGNLEFYESLAQCVAEEQPDVALLSSVLPYLEHPYEVLRELIGFGLQYLIIDRTPLIEEGEDRLTVQKVPAEIYPASYPAWILQKRSFLDVFQADYEMVAEFDALAGVIPLGDITAVDRGFIFRKRSKLAVISRISG